MENTAMDPERWQNIERLYHATLECEESQRADFLTRACCGDEVLRREVESLVSYGIRSERFIEGSALESVAPALAGDEGLELDPGSDERRMIGKRIAQYRIVERLGRGGMGEVYRAVRADDQFQKQVAIKLVHAGEASGFVVGRFKNERQILASLDHPNIARLLDGGATDEGVPYFVMELVEGQPIDKYCDSRKLGIPARLQLFQQVCSALQYSHRRQIIHRDIKPANILVTSEGALKLLDFGIAKILDSGTLTGAPGPIQTRFRAFTPEYASPEQIKAEPISTASDVYSLGVLLYELLTGHRPYRFKTHTPSEIERVICEEEPLKPSTVVTRLEESTLADGTTTSITPGLISGVRDSDPKHMHSCLLGDLDAIVMTALRKEPDRRYASADDLSQDILKHLEGLPITARPNSIAYRGAKLIRRRRELAVSGLVIFVLMLLVLFSGLSIWQAHRSSTRVRLTENDTIVLADFNNSTGDAIFDGILRQALAIQLEQSPFLNVLTDEKAAEWLKLMQRPASERLTPQVARELCLRSNSTALVEGSIARIGQHYWLAVKAVDCSKGNRLASAEKELEDKNEVLRGLEKIGNDLRQELGESLASVQNFSQPLEQATTHSLEALQAFTQGAAIHLDGKGSPLPYYKLALELDPDFVMARSYLGAYYMHSDPTLGIRNIKLAYDARNRVSLRERFELEGVYYSKIRDLPSAIRCYEDWIHTYPRDWIPHGNLGPTYWMSGKFEKAVVEEREALRLRPNAFTYGYLVWFLAILNHPAEAKLIYEEAERHGQTGFTLRDARYAIAFLQNDKAAMREQVALAMKGPHAQDLLDMQSDTEAYYGHLRRAREFSQRAVRSAENEDERQSVAEFTSREAQREVEVGNVEQARQKTGEALKLGLGTDDYVSAIVGGREIAQAEKLAAKLGQEYPMDTIVQRCSLPTIRAVISLKNNNPRRTIEMLDGATPYIDECGSLYPAYLRGQAYLRLRRGQQAAAEFQEVLDNPGMNLNNIIGALAHLQLGRAQILVGDKAAARKAYKDFLTLWKDADSDIPIFRQAKIEYAKLQ
jgi:eukaryotic-like serine/threonine-protein kinase